MRSEYGHRVVHPDTVGIGPTDGPAQTFASFLDEQLWLKAAPPRMGPRPRLYLFNRLDTVVNASEQARLLPTLPLWRGWSNYRMFLAVGGRGTGIGFHEHGDSR